MNYLFARADYVAFHGRDPSLDWHEATPADLRRAQVAAPRWYQGGWGGIRRGTIFTQFIAGADVTCFSF